VSNGDESVVGNRLFLEELDIPVDPIASDAEDSGASEVFVARNRRFVGVLRVADTMRPEAVEAVGALRSMGFRTILLTGDQASVARFVAARLGVDEFESQLLPEHKLQRVQKLMGKNHTVIMIGDGINDAPALMQASVGVAMGSGTDVATETANVILLGNNLLEIVTALKIAKRVYRIIMVNFTGTLVVDGIGVLLASLGYLNPLFAAFIHVSSEMAFILNSARLLPSVRK
jgi:Cd2+/Zn2+-exporting ATPase/Cu+-exporting ATPase